jgi:hypothetical protein
MNYYARYLRQLKSGAKLSPRGMETRVQYNQMFEFVPGTCWRRPGDNPAIGFIEGLQFIAGMESKDAIKAAAPHVNIDLFGPTSFYGPRTIGQFEQAIDELHHDQQSRRAVVQVAHYDDTPDTIPCTQSLTYYVNHQDPSLECSIVMRSSDAVWGLPYDMIQFGMVIQAMASCLELNTLTASVFIVNAHVYMDHDGGNKWDLYGFTMPEFGLWETYRTWAKAIVDSCPNRHDLEAMFELKLLR